MRWKWWRAPKSSIKPVEQLLLNCITRQLPHLGGIACNASVVATGEYKAKVVLPKVVLDFSYDQRDRFIGIAYRSLEAQTKLEQALGFERLHLFDSGDSACMLLRGRGFDMKQSVEIFDLPAMDHWMATFFEALSELASDMLAGEAEGLGASSTPPSPAKGWQKVDQ